MARRKKKSKGPYGGDIASKLTAYEAGEMDFDEKVKFFQELIDRGTIMHLQGGYQETAYHLVEAGHCHWKGERHALPR